MPTLGTSRRPDVLSSDVKKLARPIREACARLVAALVSETSSHAAVIRTPSMTDRRVLIRIKEEYAEGFGPKRFGIKPTKDMRCWKRSPLRTWGQISIRKDDKAHQKTWMPISLGQGVVGVLVLYRESEHPYDLDDVADQWFMSQRFISTQIEEDEHERFCRVAESLHVLRNAKSFRSLLHSMCHSVTSFYGMGWSRVWLLEQLKREKGDFKCIYSHGSVNQEERAKRIEDLEKMHEGSILEEIKTTAAQPKSNDSLYRVCSTVKSPLRISLKPRAAEELLSCVDTPEYRSILFTPNGHFDRFAHKFQSGVLKAAKEKGFSYETAHRTFLLPMESRGNTRIWAMNQIANQKTPSHVLSTVLINRFSRIFHDWHELGTL